MKPTYIILDSGEILEAGESRNDGVVTDAGIIPWDWILGYKAWSAAFERWMTIPLN